MIPLLYFIGLVVICGIGWVCMKVMPWSGPLAACAGLALVVVSAYQDPTNVRLMAYGGGLFGFSTLLFIFSSAGSSR